MRKIWYSAVFAALLPAAPARAEWIESSSQHFVIYADESERKLEQFSQRLERYHSALALVTGYDAPALSPSNRVTVYVVRNLDAVKKLYGEGSRYVGGFYLPRAGGSVAIIPQMGDLFGTGDSAMTVLLHEYAHHFLISASTAASPRWMTEGAAEFFSATSFEPDGSMKLGRPAVHRAYELFSERDVVAADLLDPTAYDKRKNRSYDAFYGKSWLLYHYLTFNTAREGQLTRYAALLGKGVDQRSAAQQTFGDFAVLEKELDAYLRQTRFSVLLLGPDKLKTGPIAVRKLSRGEATMMPVVIRSRRGVDEARAKQVVIEARAIAAKYPGDPAVLAALAEAEHDAGEDKAAVAAADAALALDPKRVNAYVQKGYALFRMAAQSKDKNAFKHAMEPFSALNRLENDHPLPLIYFYLTQVEQGRTPTPLALRGLSRASELAPFDLGLRFTLAMALFKEGRKDEGGVALRPIAYNPHGGGAASAARKVLAKLQAEPTWDGRDAAEVLTTAQKAAPPEDGTAPGGSEP